MLRKIIQQFGVWDIGILMMPNYLLLSQAVGRNAIDVLERCLESVSEEGKVESKKD